MSDPVLPSNIIGLPSETVVGNSTGSTTAAQAMNKSTFLTLLGKVFSDAPTTEPTTSKSIWVSSGTLKITQAIAPVGTVAIGDSEIAVGDSVTITYTQSSGVAATAFQLRKGGTNQGSSQGTGVFVLTNQQESDSGTYDVVATNDIGAAASTNTVTLSVVDLDPFYQVAGTGRYAASNGNGLAGLGSFRAVFKLLAVPNNSLKCILGRMGATGGQGWYLGTGFTGAGQMYVNQNGNAARSPVYTFITADIGSIFVVHGTYRGGKVRLYVGGSEVGTGTTVAAPVTEAAAGFSILDFSAGGGNTPDIAMISVATSSASMTADEIHADALQIQASTGYFDAPALPSQTERYDAFDLQSPATNWVSRGPGSLTLTKTGSTTVTGPL
jgi:TM2 domain-containing membrane protein YozV